MALISGFLNDLASRDDLLDAYEDDPTATMTGYGLDDKQQELILQGDLDALRSALASEVSLVPYIIVRIIVHATDTGSPKQSSGKKGGGKGGKKGGGKKKGGKR